MSKDTGLLCLCAGEKTIFEIDESTLKDKYCKLPFGYFDNVTVNIEIEVESESEKQSLKK